MQGRTAVLGLAAVLTLTLTSCGGRSEADRRTEAGRLRSSQAGQDRARNGRTMLEHSVGRERLRRNRRRGGPRPARA